MRTWVVEDRTRGAANGLAAAALFGASTPIAKLLLPGFGPLALASLLYLGAGLALLAPPLLRGSPEARLRREDAPRLALIAVLGGIVGPVLLLTGLARLPAITSSLLLNLEAPFTMLLAIVLFREHLGGRALGSSALVIAGAVVLGLGSDALRVDLGGMLAITAACLCWAVDNNLTQGLSIRDPVALVRAKTLGAGALSLGLALVAGQSFPGAGAIAGALLLGSLSYGLSIVLDTRALRLLGAAREAAFFATAPFVGAVLSVPLLGERPTWIDAAGAGGMVLGVLFLLREEHDHLHTHVELEHEHLHVHDEHHDHPHGGSSAEPHAHPHRHEPITHAHAHVSDVHHRHPHRP